MNKNYKAVVFYPAIKVSRRKGFAYVAGMVGTFIEGANGKMQPALCGGHDTGRLPDTYMSSHNFGLIFLNRLCL